MADFKTIFEIIGSDGLSSKTKVTRSCFPARIKPSRDAVRDEARKAEVIANAAALAEALGIPSSLIAELWERLVEGSIDYELATWDRERGRG